MELGPVLEPLSDFREKLLFVGGLYNEQALKGNIHSSQTGNMLSGSPLADGGEIRSGTKIGWPSGGERWEGGGGLQSDGAGRDAGGSRRADMRGGRGAVGRIVDAPAGSKW